MSDTAPASRIPEHCDTLMFDMDGTLLDLAFDTWMWLDRIPAAYAELHGLDAAAARRKLYLHYERLQGQLDWYCLDHWSERLGLDVLAIHRAEHARIGWLPGALDCLAALAGRGLRLLLVTNSHPDTLHVKSGVTGIRSYFDGIYTSHGFGHAKEAQAFWHALAEAESFDPARTLFVDDTAAVLDSARRYGVMHLLEVTRPDSGRPVRTSGRFDAIEAVAELLPGPPRARSGSAAARS